VPSGCSGLAESPAYTEVTLSASSSKTSRGACRRGFPGGSRGQGEGQPCKGTAISKSDLSMGEETPSPAHCPLIHCILTERLCSALNSTGYKDARPPNSSALGMSILQYHWVTFTVCTSKVPKCPCFFLILCPFRAWLALMIAQDQAQSILIESKGLIVSVAFICKPNNLEPRNSPPHPHTPALLYSCTLRLLFTCPIHLRAGTRQPASQTAGIIPPVNPMTAHPASPVPSCGNHNKSVPLLPVPSDPPYVFPVALCNTMYPYLLGV
jgi:hypothetical protein